MHRLTVLCSFLGSIALLGCAGAPDAEGEREGRADDSIINGTQDNAHTAVVALFSQQSGCTGTILQVKGGNGYVLTAAHCCTPQDWPEWVLTGVDYNAPTAVYGVVPGSVTPDPAYNGQTHDFCMLQFSGAPANMPFIPPATSQAQDGLQVGSQVEFVGYGIAGTPQNHNNFNSVRNHITGALDQLTNLTVQYNQQNNNGGPCSGDSGGPALVQPNAQQSQQLVVAVTSYGDVNCAVYGVSGRVSGVYNNFIGPYLNGQPIQPAQDCQTCTDSATMQGGACGAVTQTCFNNPSCSGLVQCFNGCGTQACIDNCVNQYPNGVNEYNAVIDCICYTGCTAQCAAECGPPPSGCGLQSADPTCEACLESKCCAQAQACADDQSCVDCLVQNPPASCNNNGPLNALASCIFSSCNAECNGGSSSSSSTGGSSTTSTTGSGPGTTTGTGGAPGTTTTGTGGAPPGTGGAPPGVGGAGGAGGNGEGGDQTKRSNDTGEIGGCGCVVAGGDEEQTPPVLAGLALAAALAAVRRRRAR